MAAHRDWRAFLWITALLWIHSAILVVPVDSFTAISTKAADFTTRTLLLQQTRRAPSVLVLSAKKKRRRKQASVGDASSGADAPDDLPDFELKEETVSNKPQPAKAQPAVSDRLDEITPAMMSQGLSQQPARSVRDLIADRSLEKMFEFEAGDDDIDEALPDLVEMMRNQATAATASSTIQGTDSTVGKKKARQAERRAAALAREELEREENKNILDDLLGGIPFLVDKEKGEDTPLKIVEAGTWFCIGLLISWEIYINSPFFDRVAPLAPIVY